ncbi:MAG: SUMF1/EgtB/PvdO family nonheme iron enzyme [Chitinophagales bacterium]|jgi:sulfatase modifying factor 1|nr:SUMF1/EgtB/PvdO family nonheme iron enzyme [Bacteroidota bacterium]MBK9555337.1 SUMF1/EgtB/PvdO family nonheme iron enzyme [Bacteroidota bacterium]MBL0279659.1 SUMF1/EgtB/PvdO family nonheme iron enzyme [Bacteroidota bacterium]MBP8248799.1 SUMF1/EgtB/PvdO family nonheme iron enzyme [Chitinophagales bacterium]MBP9878452.1 SUMF1/EgtB/PvdO family nonheme iron enzyme [Chitinophagales bacterium]
MKRNLPLLTFACVAIIFGSGCSSSGWGDYRGQLLGMQDRPEWEPVNPFGMVYIPSGTLHIGPSDQDVNNSLWQRTKSISIQGFYMDDAEITNNEYRQFVFWVKDSISHVLLDHYQEEEEGQETEVPLLDWDEEIDWDDEETRSRLEELYLPASETYYGIKAVDTRQLIYNYRWAKWKEAASKSNRDKNIADFIVEEPVMIYPDTLTWVHDYTYSYNEPMTRQYFSHPSFDDYPVVGVSWKQANAFCTWRSDFWNDWRRQHDEVQVDDFRLPTEHEWEYAARGGRDQAPYPWGGPYVRNTKGCYLANFKPGRGAYPEDGGYYTVKVYSYAPNDFGVYNMAGNVSEWTSTAFSENSYSFIHDENPDYRYDAEESDPPALKRKVIRGGSWKDISYYIQTGSRHWEFQDTAKCYVGFRCCMTFLGRSMSDF